MKIELSNDEVKTILDAVTQLIATNEKAKQDFFAQAFNQIQPWMETILSTLKKPP